MHWTRYLASLPDEDAALLVNALTAGAGHASLAVRLMDQNAATADVLTAWTRAGTALLLARRLSNAPWLGADAAHALPDSYAAPVLPCLVPWRDFLLTCGSQPAEHLMVLLLRAVGDARTALTAVVADGDVEVIRLHLVGAVAALGEARRLIATPAVA